VKSIGYAQEDRQNKFIKEVVSQGQLLLGNDFDGFVKDDYFYLFERYEYNKEMFVLVSQISTNESKPASKTLYCSMTEGDWALFSDPYFNTTKSQALKFEFYIAKYKCN